MRIYGLKNCDTCRKALKSLPHAEFLDVRMDGVPDVVLTTALEIFGDAMINTRSTTWRGLGERERSMTPIDLLQLHPTLMKRPLITTEDAMHLGWTAKTQQALAVA